MAYLSNFSSIIFFVAETKNIYLYFSRIGGSTGTGGSSSVDPLIAGEINWSVSQLRSLFNQGLGKAAAAAQQQHNQINHSHLSRYI